MEPESLLPLRAMARRLRIPMRWLRNEVEAGRLPHTRAGSAILFSPPAVERVLIERASIPPTNRPTPEASE